MTVNFKDLNKENSNSFSILILYETLEENLCTNFKTAVPFSSNVITKKNAYVIVRVRYDIYIKHYGSKVLIS